MRISIAVFLLLSACRIDVPPSTPPSSPPPTECSVEANAWNNFHLPLPHGTAGPIVVRVINESGYELDLSGWNRADSAVVYRDTGDGFPMTFRKVDKPDAGWIGIVTVRVDGRDHIVSAEVQLNAPLLERYGDNGIQHVACQEGVHGAGLDHQRGPGSCMDDCAGRGAGGFGECLRADIGRRLNDHDFAELAIIYSHAVEAPPCAGQGARTILVHRFMVPSPLQPGQH